MHECVNPIEMNSKQISGGGWGGEGGDPKRDKSKRRSQNAYSVHAGRAAFSASSPSGSWAWARDRDREAPAASRRSAVRLEVTSRMNAPVTVTSPKINVQKYLLAIVGLLCYGIALQRQVSQIRQPRERFYVAIAYQSPCLQPSREDFFTRKKENAEVHLLACSQRSGSGRGRECGALGSGRWSPAHAGVCCHSAAVLRVRTAPPA